MHFMQFKCVSGYCVFPTELRIPSSFMLSNGYNVIALDSFLSLHNNIRLLYLLISRSRFLMLIHLMRKQFFVSVKINQWFFIRTL